MTMQAVPLLCAAAGGPQATVFPQRSMASRQGSHAMKQVQGVDAASGVPLLHEEVDVADIPSTGERLLV